MSPNLFRSLQRSAIAACVAFIATAAPAQETQYSWRYYRPGNTGIQGDYCDALWIGADDDPWIGGYDPSFEEGGIAKFVQAENRWINISNVDYPVIGHPDDTGTTRVRDITADADGNLWMGTGCGVLKFNPSIGPASLTRYGADNSPWPGGWVTNIEIAPDGSIWASGYSTAWGGGGLMRFNPATSAWTYLGSNWPEVLAIQPKPGGGYYVWAADGPGTTGLTQRFDSTTQTWATFHSTSGMPRNLPGNKCVDPAGNMWIYRVLGDGFNTVMDCRRPDGTWIGVPTLPDGGSVTRAFATNQALTVSNGQVWRFNGSSWTALGNWGNIDWTYDLAIDSVGAVWACGVGGAAKRDATTGLWQRYRITNTGNFDSFNRDLTIDPVLGHMYTGANAGSGVGGMTRFDGQRWAGWNQVTYGLGWNWPFQNDSCNALAYRASNGRVVVSPLEWLYGIHEWNGTNFTMLMLDGGAERMCEDSLGRLWVLGEYFNLQYYNGSTWTQVGITAWGSKIQKDPDLAGAVWATTGHEIVRTDGVYRFSRLIDDFSELTTQSDTFSGLAAAPNGIAWIGATVQYGAGGSGGALIRIDSNSGAYQMLRYDQGWPLPGMFVSPLAVTPDGRVWMQYDTDYLTAQRGLCWYDPADGSVGVFPAPAGGEPQWGGLPHAAIEDCEVLEVPGGYELWMGCVSRGIAVLSVTKPPVTGDTNGDGVVNVIDLLAVIGSWGACAPPCTADINSDGAVNVLDLLTVINNWG